MIERHITFAVHPQRTVDFEQFFAETYRPPVLDMPGLLECCLLRDLEDPTRYLMVFRWETSDQAAAWRTSDVHQGLQPALNGLHGGMDVVAYERRVG